MNIHKSLKVKNRLVGELARLRSILQRENSRRNDNLSTVNCSEVSRDAALTLNRLVRIKAAIAVASTPVVEKLVRMAELKAEINFLRSIPTRRGVETVFIGRDQEKLDYTWSVYLTQEEIDVLIKSDESVINSFQDDVDAFNSTTNIDYAE